MSFKPLTSKSARLLLKLPSSRPPALSSLLKPMSNRPRELEELSPPEKSMNSLRSNSELPAKKSGKGSLSDILNEID